eukprot:TRINITY_DN66640_c4_g1_i3.p1 TRINITY_DN66640_c4_g1~~TRINITY_DN66640_c4_g1_i3.p1  ORF type:complete len:356 (-),score=16.26 TRINITY_DN66640_c4_g1_i3:21-1088(-)
MRTLFCLLLLALFVTTSHGSTWIGVGWNGALQDQKRCLVWRSTDEGKTWTKGSPIIPTSTNGTTPNVTICGGIAVTSNNNLFVSTYQQGLLKSTDGGVSWKVMEGHPFGPMRQWSIAFSPNGKNGLILGQRPGPTDPGIVLVSNDSGDSWKILNAPFPGVVPLWGAISWVNDTSVAVTLSVGYTSWVLLSHTQGQSWQKTKLISTFPPDVAMVPGTSFGLVGGSGQGNSWGASYLWKSTDAGNTWAQITSYKNRASLVSLCPLDKTGGFLGAAEFGIQFTHDHGATWKNITYGGYSSGATHCSVVGDVVLAMSPSGKCGLWRGTVSDLKLKQTCNLEIVGEQNYAFQMYYVAVLP